MSSAKLSFSFFLRALLLLVCVVGVAFLALQGQKPPLPKPSSAPPALFSAMRAGEALTWIASAPHPLGSKAHGEVRDKLVAAFKQVGLEAQTQHAKVALSAPEVGLAHVENILVRVKGNGGAGASGAVMLVAHYDSVPGSPGAADDGAGVATVLEVARVLKASLPLKRDVILLLTDGEEVGMLGAKAFVEQHPWAKDVKWVVNLDARGSGGPVWVYETTANNDDILQALGKVSRGALSSSALCSLYPNMPNKTDLTVFREANMRGVGLAFLGQAWHYHRPTDARGNLSMDSLQQMGHTALELVRIFAGKEAASKTAGEAVFFNLYGDYLVHYPEKWVPWITLVIAALSLLLLILGIRHKQLEGLALLKVMLAFPVSLVVAAVLGVVFQKLLALVHPLWGMSDPVSFFFNPWYSLSLLGVALGAAWLLLRTLGQKVDFTNLQVGGLVGWAIVTAAVSHFFPGLSYLFQWPLLIALLCALFFSDWLKAQVPVALLLMLLYAPMLDLMAVALGMDVALAVTLPLLVLLMAWLVLSLLAFWQKGWLLSLSAAACLVGGLYWGRQWTLQAFTHRPFSSLEYHLNVDQQNAQWVCDTSHPAPFTGNIKAGEPTWRGPVQVVKESEKKRLHQEAPLLSTPTPKLTLLSNEEKEGMRVMRFSVEAGGARDWRLIGEGNGLAEALIGDFSLPLTASGVPNKGVAPQKDWQLEIYGGEPKPVEVTLKFAAGQGPVEMVLRARYDGLPGSPDTQTLAPEQSKPIRQGHSTLVTRALTVP